MASFIAACSGSSSSSSGSEHGGAEAFGGVQQVTPNKDGTWTVWWPAVVGTSDIRYYVYQRAAAETFDFDKPIQNTIENTFITSDLRLAGNTCFVVRFTQSNNTSDQNTKELCTNHEPYTFAGVDEIVSLKDGTYILKWQEPPFGGAQFQVLQRPKSAEEWKPLAVTTDAFYKTDVLSLDETTCFIVHYVIKGFADDQNEKEVCTPQLGDSGFRGVQALSSPGAGQLLVTWTPVTADSVAGYHVYLGNDFKQLIGKVDGAKVSEYLVKDLLHSVVYTVGVRAVDRFGREDRNKVVISYELKNHQPVVSSANLEIIKVTPWDEPRASNAWQNTRTKMPGKRSTRRSTS